MIHSVPKPVTTVVKDIAVRIVLHNKTDMCLILSSVDDKGEEDETHLVDPSSR